MLTETFLASKHISAEIFIELLHFHHFFSILVSYYFCNQQNLPNIGDIQYSQQ